MSIDVALADGACSFIPVGGSHHRNIQKRMTCNLKQYKLIILFTRIKTLTNDANREVNKLKEMLSVGTLTAGMRHTALDGKK